jgi:small subunit ribosomal protein S1
MSVQRSAQSFSASDFANALAAHDYQFNVGQIVTGKVVQHESDGAYVDIGAKSLGFLPVDEASLGSAKRLSESIPIGTEQQFLIIREQNEDGELKLSIRRLQMKLAWNILLGYQAEAKVFNCRVLSANKGGVVVDAEGLRGFIPRSHLVDKNNFTGLIGKTIPVVLVEIDETRNKLIVSNRLAAQASAMSQLSKGQLVTGKVSSIRPFGAFIDFGGVSGLLHVKEISQKYVSDINSVFKEGETIKVVVMEVDESRNRISLSTKILELHQGEMLENSAQVFEEAEARLEKNISKLWDA